MARLRTWLRSLVADAPAGDLGSLDVRDGVRAPSPVAPFSDWDETRPVGECPPMTDGEAALMFDILATRDCLADDTSFDEHVADALALSNPAAEMLPSRGARLGDEVEAWLAGGAR